MELPYKKRHRVPASCSVCRKRKLKCDRVKPVCGSCKLKSIAHLCFYESEAKDGPITYNQFDLPLIPNNKTDPNDPLNTDLSKEHIHIKSDNVNLNTALPQSLNHIQTTNIHNIPIHNHNRIPIQTNNHIQNHNVNHDLPKRSPNISPNTFSPSVPIPQANYIPNSNGKNFRPDSRDSYYSISSTNNGGSPHLSPNNVFHRSPEVNIPLNFSSDYTQGQNLVEEEELITIPLSGTTLLKVNPNDTLNVFANASYPLNVEGFLWQQQGLLSYVGLTKSDPFVKIVRNFALLLFKSGSLGKFVKQPKKRKSSNELPEGLDFENKRPNLNTTFEHNEEHQIDNAEDDVLVTTKIDRGSADDNDDDDDDDNESEVENNAAVEKERTSEGSNTTDLEKKRSASSALSTHETEIKSPESVISHSVQNYNTLSLLFTGSKKRQAYYKMVERAVLVILPEKIDLYLLFRRFFKYVHPFIPIIDEKSLLKSVESIFGSFPDFSHEKYKELKIKDDNDLIVLTNFLILVRLGYTSLIHNDEVVYTQDEQRLVNCNESISPKTFKEVLNLCINDCFVQSKSSLNIVQALTLLYFYRGVDPNDCHGLGGADSQILLGVIIKHAMSIGLNRDPTFYKSHPSICNNVELIKRWRGLWHYLVYVDASTSIYGGSYLHIGNLDMSDVQLPYYDEKSEPVNIFLNSIEKICRLYRKIVIKINNVRNKPKIIDILRETNELEKIFFSLFGQDYFKEHICKPAAGGDGEKTPAQIEADGLKVVKVGIFLTLRTNLSCMYYMIAIHYENEITDKHSKSMNAGLELFKIYIKSVVQLVFIMTYVLENSIELFGKNYDYLLTAMNQKCMIKTHSFLTSFFVRLLHHKRYLSIKLITDPSVKPRLEVTNRLYELVLRESELFVGNFRRLSGKYANSYRIYVVTYVVLKQCMTNPDAFFGKTYDAAFHYGTNTLQFFTISELEYLSRLCEEFKGAKSGQYKSCTASMNHDEFITHMKEKDQDKNSESKSFKDLAELLKEKNVNYDEESFGLSNADVNNNIEANFDYAMLDNPNVDLVQLFELFVETEVKDPHI